MMIKTKVLGLFIIVMLLMTIISAYRVTTQSKEVFLKNSYENLKTSRNIKKETKEEITQTGEKLESASDHMSQMSVKLTNLLDQYKS